jgi:hypothetical protein
MPFSLHIDPRFGGDIFAINRIALSIVNGNELVNAPYPPLAMFLIGLYQSILHSTSSQFSFPDVGNQFQTNFNPEIFSFLFTTKILFLLFELLLVFYGMRLFWDNQDKRRKAWLFLVFNPILIYNAYLHGQYDIIPIFFLVLSLYFVKGNKPRWAAFWMGIGGCFKNFPLLFSLPLIIIVAKSWRERFILLLLSIVPYIFLMLPFLGQYNAGINRYSNWYFKVGYDIGFGGQVYIFFALYAVLMWFVAYRRLQGFDAFWRVCLVTLLLYYPFSYFDLHYYAWLMPFAALYLVEKPRVIWLYLAAFLCLLVLLFQTPVARFFAPISPEIFLRMPSLMEILSPYLPILFIMNVFRSFLVGTLFWLAWLVVRELLDSRAPVLAGEEIY